MKRLLNIFLFFLFFAITIIALDRYLIFSEVIKINNIVFTEKYGTRDKENAAYTYFNEGFSMGIFNKSGFVGPDIAQRKNTSDISIVVIGDSFLKATQIFERNHLIYVIKDKLKEAGINAEVFNIPYNGGNLQDFYVLYHDYAASYSLDYIIYFLRNEDFALPSKSVLQNNIMYNEDTIIINNHKPYSKSAMLKHFPMLWNKSAFFTLIGLCQQIVTENLWIPKIFEKLAFGFQQTNIQKQKSDFIIEDEMKLNILLKTINSNKEKVIFASIEPLNDKIISKIKKAKIELIELNTIEKKELHFFKSTKKQGHWNIHGHAYVGNIIANHLKNYKR